MKSVRCSKCGLTNWVDAESCKRCQTPLQANTSTYGQAENAPDASSSLHWLVAPLTFLLLITGAFLVYTRWGALVALFKNYGQYEVALKGSNEFKEPLTVEACKQPASFSGRGFNSSQEASTAAKVLEGAGLILITTSTRDLTIPGTNSFTDSYGRSISLPPVKLGSYTAVDLKLTERGQQESAGWQTIKEENGREGWRVPIGRRELIKIVSAEEQTDAAKPGESRMAVGFAWQWKPNAVGEYFDKSTGAYQYVAKRLNGMDAVTLRDSRDTRYGVAQMRSSNGQWVIDSINWNAPSPQNDAEAKKLDEILERAR